MLVPAATTARAVTPANATMLPNGTARGLWVGGVGNVTVQFNPEDSAAVTFTAVPAGTFLPVEAWSVNSTGTTATLIVALY